MKLKACLRSIPFIIWRVFRLSIFLFLIAFTTGGAIVPTGGFNERVRTFTREQEFDFVTWTIDAAVTKFSSWALSAHRFMTPEEQSQLVLDYLDQVRNVQTLNHEMLVMYSDPTIDDLAAASQPLKENLNREIHRLESLAPLAESILQNQIMDIIHDEGLGFLGQVIPPTLYHVSDIPYNLIISPRSEITSLMSVSLTPGLSVDVMDHVEQAIYYDLDHAALVVPIGGMASYPAMVMQTSNLVRLTEIIAHEWVHNYLMPRPLGYLYFNSEEIRTINESVATLAGIELGLLTLQKYYPEHIPPELLQPQEEPKSPPPVAEPDPDAFDFRLEMRETRVTVDELLAQGTIEAAEAYMEARRQFFWENGFRIRKLNQAYFAFYGAYNVVPGGGPSGDDPIGPAVVTFREQSPSLADFLNDISWIDSFESLLALLDR